MSYDLMLLADPGTARGSVLTALSTAPDITPDPGLPHRFWLQTPHGKVQINIGTKDPVESVHCELTSPEPSLVEVAARRALALAAELDMRVEDVQWGHELTAGNVSDLLAHLQGATSRASHEKTPKPWWAFWR